jgi:Helix-turn-helix domain
MEPERIELSQRERVRLKVLHEVERGHLPQVEASRRLRWSDRQVRRLQVRVRADGDRGLIHQLRGRPSNRKIFEKIRQRILARARSEDAQLARGGDAWPRTGGPQARRPIQRGTLWQ